MTRELIAEAGAAAERLDVFLTRHLTASRSHSSRLIRAGAVQVNGQLERPSYLMQPGDRITVTEPQVASSTPPLPNLPIVYEDADMLVIDKPAGISTHPGTNASSEPAAPTVADFARLHTTDPDPERPGIVHRLDRDTSGLLIIAKTPAAKAYLQQAFRDHAVHKTYTLLAVGRVDPPTAVINLPLDRDPAHPLRRAVVASGRPAITRYRTLAAYPGYSLIQAQPETGRTHQLRVHFAAIGHPIAGDQTYHATKRRQLQLERQFLHASALEYTAPSGQHISLRSPLPADLQQALTFLEESL